MPHYKPNGAERKQNNIRRFWMSKWPPGSGEPIKQGGGASPPTSPDGFPEGRRPFRSQKSSTVGFYLSTPFGTAPFYGNPIPPVPKIIILRSRPGNRRFLGVETAIFLLKNNFSADFQPNLAPKPIYNDGARPAVPVAPKISPADQF